MSFRVDAYPTRSFTGEVEQVRLNPVVAQNVVVYAGIISANNPALELKPGMTANLTIEVARRDDVLRVPSGALRFRPTDATLAALGQALKRSTPTAKGISASEPARAAEGTVWLFDGGLHAARVSTGISDGAYTEVLGDQLTEGSAVATRVVETASAPRQAGSREQPADAAAGPRRGARGRQSGWTGSVGPMARVRSAGQRR